MNKNQKKHDLLKILSKQFVAGWGTKEPCGLLENEIEKILKIDNFQLKTLVSDLCENGEIKHYAPDGDGGWMATGKGVTSFNTKKYIREKHKNIWNTIRNWVQTLIPVLSLIIAIIAIKSDNEAIKIELQELKDEQSQIKASIDIIQSVEKDSLRIK